MTAEGGTLRLMLDARRGTGGRAALDSAQARFASYEGSTVVELPATRLIHGDSNIDTSALWFGDPARPLLGWLSRPSNGIGASGIVIAPPVDYAYWSSHRTLRVLAQELALTGHSVLRIDYDGTGDSSGDQWEDDRIVAWRRTIALAANELRNMGAARITLVGARLGGTFALLEGRTLDAAKVVAWMPVTAGRRYAKELRLLATAVPEDLDPLDPPGTMVFAGNVFSSQTVNDLRRLSLNEISESPAPATLVLDDPGGSAAEAVQHLRSIGADVTHLELPGSEHALQTATEFATVPEAIVGAICEWIGVDGSAASARSVVRPHGEAELRWRTGRVNETVLRLGAYGHVGVLTSPPNPDPDPESTTLVFLNPGSETYVGPGRAWVEYARDLALAGRRSVRIDFLGWGRARTRIEHPGRPYDASCEEDTVAIVQELQQEGFRPVALCGLCASA
jgi:pimeloyl-ACP methyl ester carboxylesterase